MKSLPARPKALLSLLASATLLASCAGKKARSEETRPVSDPAPGEVNTAARNKDYESRISSGWSFPVEVVALQIVDYPPEFVPEIRDQFLGPLAESPYVGRIAKVEIDTGSSDWAQWTCLVRPMGDFPIIRIKGENAFRDGRNAKTPYAKAVAKVLRELAHMDQAGRATGDGLRATSQN